MIANLQTGDRVLVWRAGRLLRGIARYKSITRDGGWHVYDERLRTVIAAIDLADEGVWWCREWDGPAANALTVMVALR